MKRMGTIIQMVTVSVIIIAIIYLSSCEKITYNVEAINPGGGSVDTVHFATQVQPIFTSHCITCHHPPRSPDLREGYSYASLTSGGYVTSPAASSRLYKQLTSSSHTSFTIPAEKQTIYDWILQGAMNN